MANMKLNFKNYLFLLPIACITLHAFFMNGYYYQHRMLTVGTYLSSIFAKVDPSLYKNSIYIQAVNRTNLRLSLFYDISPFIFKYFDFETFALVQSIVSLFFILAGIFVLTRTLFDNETAAYLSTLLYTTELNNWTLGSPAPYLNFFHHGLPFTYPLIVWSMVAFIKKRLSLSFLLAGLSWNFHPMTTAFLLFSYSFYWLCNRKEFSIKTIFNSLAVFTITASPVLIKSLFYNMNSDYSSDLWITGVKWCLYFTNFPSMWYMDWIVRAWLFFALFLCVFFILPSKHHKTILLFIISVAIMCIVGTVFADLFPIRFIIKLSLWRSTIIYLLVALPCISFALAKLLNQSISKKLLVCCIIVLVTGYLKITKWYFPVFIILLVFSIYGEYFKGLVAKLYNYFSLVFFGSIFVTIVFLQFFFPQNRFLVFFILSFLYLILTERVKQYPFFAAKKWVFLAVYIFLFDLLVLFYRGGPDIYYRGKVRGKYDLWADIQFYAQAHTKKDDLFIVPPYMNDFTTYSKRAVLGDWAEGSTLIYLDRQFTEEWFARMHDLRCKPYAFFNEYDKLTTKEIYDVAKKYGAKYVVTKKPKQFNLQKIYENDRFVLYQVP